MHLGDRLTRRNEILVICWDHSLDEISGLITPYTTVWLLLPKKEVPERIREEYSREEALYSGRFVIIAPLTENAREWWEINHPNLYLDMVPLLWHQRVSRSEVIRMLYELDWAKILKRAVESRPEAWGESLIQWKNASDTLIPQVIRELEEAGYLLMLLNIHSKE